MVGIHKGKEKGDIRNSCPISFLLLSGKLTKIIMYKHIMNHLDKETILNNKQGGFRKGFSSTYQLYPTLFSSTISNLTKDTLRGMNKGGQTTITFIDFSKAFNTVSHVMLI